MSSTSRPSLPARASGMALFLLLSSALAACGEQRRDLSPLGEETPPPASTAPAASNAPTTRDSTSTDPASGDSAGESELTEEPAATLPGGSDTVFGKNNFIVSYYGAPGSRALGVLGETPLPTAHRRLLKAAKAFKTKSNTVVPAYDLIATVADRYPGKDGDYNHDISKAAVKEVIDFAAKKDTFVIIDIQPGRSTFLRVAKRWAWALESPHVGLALDGEWRVKSPRVPGRDLGTVTAQDVNRTSAWLADLTADAKLPEKIFMLHQFHSSTFPTIGKVKQRDGLVNVLHVDGFGPPGSKRETYNKIAYPKTFTMGFKLFYDEDKPIMSARDVLGLKPQVRFVSFQ